MGLIREIIDEILPLPTDKVHHIVSEDNVNSFHFKFIYATLNIILQTIDCILIPFYAIVLFTSLKYGLGFFKIGLFLVMAFASIFSIYQFVYWFFKSPEDYVSLNDRILGETALGALLSSIFKIKVFYFWKR